MRKLVLALFKKLRFRWCGFYTWMLRSSLKRCGKGVRIEFPVRFEQPQAISIGDRVIVYPRVWLNPVRAWAGGGYEGEIVVGNRVMIGYGVQISSAKSVVIEDDVCIASGVVIVDHIHDHTHVDTPVFLAPLSVPEPVRIGESAFLGVNCFIGPGVQIGEHAVVAANAHVVRNVPAYCTAIGNPARFVRFHTQPAETSTAEAYCEARVG